MKLLLLYGVNCQKCIWNRLTPYLMDYEIDYVEYPHNITKTATSVEDITKWVYRNYHQHTYDAVIGHSLGGIIALQLAAEYHMRFHKIIYLDTNLVPANDFYHNLMTAEHSKEYGQEIIQMFANEKLFYHPELFQALQNQFDYTHYLQVIAQKVYAIYGDRGLSEYPNKISDLNLPKDILNRLELKFISNACHMIMMENPKELSMCLKDILCN